MPAGALGHSARFVALLGFIGGGLVGCDINVEPPPTPGHSLPICRGVAEIDCAGGEGVCQHGRATCDEVTGWRCEPSDPGAHEDVETRCDGRDNDCDGATDEDLGSQTCGLGVCEHTVALCTAGAPQACEPLLGASDEICNGMDDDCDGLTDEDLDSPLSANQLGVCAGAVAVCGGSLGWIEPDYIEGLGFEVVEKSCDGKDNDCDGETDELGFFACGLGACARALPVCDGGVVQSCDAFAGARDESCDGADDDCDGETDEDLVAAPPALNVGVCAGLQQVCNGPAGWSEPDVTSVAGYEAVEVSCDGKDNDCDGATDENSGTVACGTGVCAHSEGACVDGQLVGCDAFRGASAEVCDGLDNDCDGLTDEGLDAPRGLRTSGICGAALQVCSGVGGWVEPGYASLPGYQDVETRCDGRDNDCDGQVDEGLGSLVCGRGQCEHTVAACVGGQPSVCDPLAGASEEVCDGIDNDCNGIADDDLVAPDADHAAGVCAPFVKVCRGATGWSEPDYVDIVGFQVHESSCDGLDNDCDGLTDENLGTTTCGVGVCRHASPNCTNGTVNVCDPFAGKTAELCNGVDDDCDGLTDDGATCGGGQVCQAGACVAPPASCGNGVLEVGEACDDGNVVASDECDASCQIVPPCDEGCTRADSGACICQVQNECSPGETKCVDGTYLACDSSHHWLREECSSRCPASIGSHCEANPTTRVVSGTVAFQTRTANAALTDWGDVFVRPLVSAQVVSYVWQPESATFSVFDRTATRADGSYDIKMPQVPSADDVVVVWLVRLDAQGKAVIAVANPSFPTSGRKPVFDVLTQGAASNIWSFSVASASLITDPAILITETAHSAVASVFAHMRYIYEATLALFGTAGDPLVLWMQPDVTWECGACTSKYPTTVGVNVFASSIWIAYSADQAYWSDAVVVHELGHWVMSSYGTSPREGGVHYVGQPTLPGQAWSEGFATFFSSLARGNQLYFDKQNGNFFWFDLREMAYASRGMALPTADGVGYPYPDDPILQLMDENVVAAMSYAMALGSQPAGVTALPRLESEGVMLMQALASPRMNVKRANPGATFQRRYVRHTWTLDADHHIANITPIWTSSSPMFADYLDAVRCLGNATGRNMDALVAESILTYPYPIGAAPICL